MAAVFIQPGDKYGRLTILKDSGRRDKVGSVIWLCECECGNKCHRASTMIIQSLVRGCLISCGCGLKGRPCQITDEMRAKGKEVAGYVEGTLVSEIMSEKLRKNNTSGVKGVSYAAGKKMWRARLMLRGKEHSQYFKTKEEAIAYRKTLEKMFFEPIIERWKESKEEKED